MLAVHEQTALAALISIAAHGLLLLPDHWLHPGAAGIAVPLAIGYRPVATALGIGGGYLAAILGLSFYLRRRIGPRLWRKAHMATIAVYVLSVVHTLTAGTDAATLWLRALLVATGVPIALLLAGRILHRLVPGMGDRASAGLVIAGGGLAAQRCYEMLRGGPRRGRWRGSREHVLQTMDQPRAPEHARRERSATVGDPCWAPMPWPGHAPTVARWRCARPSTTVLALTAPLGNVEQ